MKNILEYLERSARRFPDRISFADPESEVTYAGLLARARRIGTAIAAFAEPGSPVPVFMGKGVDTIEVFFGAVCAGCFYTLLDTKQPKMRLLDILGTLERDFIITSHAYDEDLAAFGFEGTVCYLEDLKKTEEDPVLLDRIRRQSLDIDPLYCNFTSGSTGVPKGVLVGHRSV
ncbi:MAG: AMP-binding protein, partial [Lachnospiraceae bacterium]|nr:AMP-binding protein [Lachnospiraceae bacterium]